MMMRRPLERLLPILVLWTTTQSSSVKAYYCFHDNTELQLAVLDYISSGYDPNSDSAITYGYPIENWCVDYVDDFSYVFSFYPDFNEPLTNWWTGNATIMESMFEGATSFNQPLPMFYTKGVGVFDYMFRGATAFNQDISWWDMKGAFTLEGMFDGAKSFKKDLCLWQWFSQTFYDVSNMFRNTSCPEKGDPDIFASPPGPFCYKCGWAPTKKPTPKPGTNAVQKCVNTLKKVCNCGLVFKGSPCLTAVANGCPSSGNQQAFTEKVRKSYQKQYCRTPPNTGGSAGGANSVSSGELVGENPPANATEPVTQEPSPEAEDEP